MSGHQSTCICAECLIERLRPTKPNMTVAHKFADAYIRLYDQKANRDVLVQMFGRAIYEALMQQNYQPSVETPDEGICPHKSNE